VANKLGLAEARAVERLERRPRNIWGWQHFAEAIDRLGDDEGASSARNRAAKHQDSPSI
jgi:predicted Zn-dependent protease